MLDGARALVRKKCWTNVDLVRADAAEMTFRAEFDGAICTISMSVIPRWQEALTNMIATVRPGKRVVIADGRLGVGFKRVGNLYARLFAGIVAADLSRNIAGECEDKLIDVRQEELLFGTYFVVSGAGGHRV